MEKEMTVSGLMERHEDMRKEMTALRERQLEIELEMTNSTREIGSKMFIGKVIKTGNAYLEVVDVCDVSCGVGGGFKIRLLVNKYVKMTHDLVKFSEPVYWMKEGIYVSFDMDSFFMFPSNSIKFADDNVKDMLAKSKEMCAGIDKMLVDRFGNKVTRYSRVFYSEEDGTIEEGYVTLFDLETKLFKVERINLLSKQYEDIPDEKRIVEIPNSRFALIDKRQR